MGFADAMPIEVNLRALTERMFRYFLKQKENLYSTQGDFENNDDMNMAYICN